MSILTPDMQQLALRVLAVSGPGRINVVECGNANAISVVSCTATAVPELVVSRQSPMPWSGRLTTWQGD